MEAVRSVWLVVVVMLVTTGVSSIAQTADERDRLRMASTYERAGDQRGAARIYQELYAASPSNDMYFQGVVRTLTALQQFEALLPVVESHATLYRTESAALLAGSLRARRGDRDAAIRWWKSAYEVSSDKEQTLVSTSNEQKRLGLYDLALASIREARALAQRDNDYPYSDELVGLLITTGEYDQAVTEILDVYAAYSDMYRAMRSLTVVLASDASHAIVRRSISKLPTSSDESIRLQQWVYRQLRDWKLALEVTVTLDSRTRARGNEILMFAEGAHANEQFDIALSAYDLVMTSDADQRTVISAAYGSVRALEQRLRGQRDLAPDDARTIIQRYDALIVAYPNHPLCADALFNAARLEDAVLNQATRAIDRLLRIQNQWRGTTVYPDAALLLASLYLTTGNDGEARSVLRALIAAPSIVVTDRKELARLMLADMDFWRGELTAARTGYAELSGDLSSAAANDAIDRLLVMDLMQDDSASVRAYATAEGMRARRNYADAYRAYMQIGASSSDADLRDRANVQAVESALALHNDTLALVPLQAVIERIPETIWGDRMLLRLADIEQRNGNRSSAIEALSSLLVAYPRSIFVPSARDRIRQLRGDSQTPSSTPE